MLFSLSHNTIGSSYNQDSTIHLCSTGDHVLNVVSMSWAVNVSVVTIWSLILNVSGRDSDSSLSLFWSLIDVLESNFLASTISCMKVEVTMPEEYMGDVIGDINSRRGRIEGMDDLGGGKIVRGYVPLAEMFGYSTDLRSKTQGRGNYSMFFEKYEPVPKNVQEKVLSAKNK